jgi:hypothetical protein
MKSYLHQITFWSVKLADNSLQESWKIPRVIRDIDRNTFSSWLYTSLYDVKEDVEVGDIVLAGKTFVRPISKLCPLVPGDKQVANPAVLDHGGEDVGADMPNTAECVATAQPEKVS